MEVKIDLTEVISRARIHLVECLQGTDYALFNQRDIDPTWRVTLEKESEILNEQVFCLDQFLNLERMMESEVNDRRAQIENDPTRPPRELAGLEF